MKGEGMRSKILLLHQHASSSLKQLKLSASRQYSEARKREREKERKKNKTKRKRERKKERKKEREKEREKKRRREAS